MSKASEIVASAGVVLLDFDGPVTPLMPAPANVATADAGRGALDRRGLRVPTEIAATTDHLAVIRWAGENAREALDDVEAACVEAEVAAAKVCVPTPGAHEVLKALYERGTPVVIVSNNAASAIDAYLERYDLGAYVVAVVGRPEAEPHRMKPDPYEVHQALQIADSKPSDAVFIGDSTSDIEVALATGVRSIGYATTPKRGDELKGAGADALVTGMASLVNAPD